MDEQLSPNARHLIDAAMEADVPADDVVESSWGMVVSRLTVDTTPAVPAPPVAAKATRRRLLVPGIIVVVVFVGVVWFATRSPKQEQLTTPVVVAQRPTTSPATPPAAPPAEPPAAKPRPVDAPRLEDIEATLALDPAHALEQLDRHAERTPLVDVDMRMALRITALCDLDRMGDALAEGKAFFATERTAESTAKVRASCVGK